MLERTRVVPRPIDEVFAFFSDPANLERLTPPWLRFCVLGATTESLGEGAEIDYRPRVRGIPLRWRSLIRAWNPPHGFVDEQLRGPYRLWVHAHTFEPVNGGTRVGDRVRYAVLGGALVDRLLVRPDLERIFDYRRERLEELLAK